jgi:hypothetical protein
MGIIRGTDLKDDGCVRSHRGTSHLCEVHKIGLEFTEWRGHRPATPYRFCRSKFLIDVLVSFNHCQVSCIGLMLCPNHFQVTRQPVGPSFTDRNSIPRTFGE